jgi:hypothetical protein
VAVIVALLVAAYFVSRGCQQSQVRITEGQAIAIAKRQVDFQPRTTQIRLLRQGLNRKPFWFVSLSNPIGSPTQPEGLTRLAIVQIDANTGKVEDVNNQVGPGAAKPKKQAAERKAQP